MEPLDLVGNIVLMLSVVIVFLLVLGLPLAKGVKSKKNLQRHGILTIVALALQTIMVFVVMVSSFNVNFNEIVTLPPMYSVNTWVHVVTGLAAMISGFAYVALWLVYSYSKMMCYRAKNYMIPTLIIWIIAIISGALIHLLQMF